MTAGDLEEVTRKKRYSKQAGWFKDQYGVEVARRGDGSIVLTWETFRAMNDRKAGLLSVRSTSPVELCFD